MVSNELLLKMYEQAVLIRKFEGRAQEGYAKGKVDGSLHTGVGQEGIHVGISPYFRPQDHTFLSHREHGILVTRGCDPKSAMAELYGKKTGMFHGKSGSVHMADLEHNNRGSCAILGGISALANGSAFAMKYKGEDAISFAFSGDGASNAGYYFESMNIAAIWELPIVFCCCNNMYAISSPIWTTTKSRNIADRAAAFQMPSVIIDGMNPLEVYEKMGPVIDYVRSGKGPYFVEFKTYRFNAHSGSDRQVYRTQDEVNEWRKKDPILQLEKEIRNRGLKDDAWFKEIEEKNEQIMADAVKFAEESPYPDENTLCTNVYFDEEINRRICK